MQKLGLPSRSTRVLKGTETPAFLARINADHVVRHVIISTRASEQTDEIREARATGKNQHNLNSYLKHAGDAHLYIKPNMPMGYVETASHVG